ncbi:MAG: hypothetical protein WBQ94_18460 [Terracidiphilus sp.]
MATIKSRTWVINFLFAIFVVLVDCPIICTSEIVSVAHTFLKMRKIGRRRHRLR